MREFLAVTGVIDLPSEELGGPCSDERERGGLAGGVVAGGIEEDEVGEVGNLRELGGHFYGRGVGVREARVMEGALDGGGFRPFKVGMHSDFYPF